MLIKLTKVQNISSVKGFVLSFYADIIYEDKHIKSAYCFSGGNNILIRTDDDIGLKINFTATDEMINKLKIIHRIISDYAPKIHNVSKVSIEIDLASRLAMQDFIIRRQIPEEYMQKYHLFETLDKQVNDALCITMEFISGQHVDINDVPIDTIREVMCKCLDHGIFPHDMSRTSNILKTEDNRVFFIDFDEWLIIDSKRFYRGE